MTIRYCSACDDHEACSQGRECPRPDAPVESWVVYAARHHGSRTCDGTIEARRTCAFRSSGGWTCWQAGVCLNGPDSCPVPEDWRCSYCSGTKARAICPARVAHACVQEPRPVPEDWIPRTPLEQRVYDLLLEEGVDASRPVPEDRPVCACGRTERCESCVDAFGPVPALDPASHQRGVERVAAMLADNHPRPVTGEHLARAHELVAAYLSAEGCREITNEDITRSENRQRARSRER